ncbi:N-acetyltransferase [Putridiphycobacter roseus]|uniref:N-acetyltransferase n=1 Tax=Putridiphycobacter roseus TaxID=2219161 RepID=A0A2W1N3X5_9FLAO|nr:GNAT family N-acetyltransferase [Putridiphycobacter roseus]PZE17751.1 N-acetyltransferase [Putridiphycobacter roseus]
MSNLKHDKDSKRFILQLEEDQKAFIEYEIIDNKYYLTYSEVPTSLRGRGVGKELVEKTFEILTEDGLKVKAICGYIKVIAMRSEKWKHIIEY